jgi:hypothetical protein
VRIQQIPHVASGSPPITRYIANETTNHFQQILQLERDIQSDKVNLSIMKVATQKLTSFIVIDRQYLLLVIDGRTADDRPYAAGMFVFEDRGGKMVEHFLRSFEHLERLATPVTLTELQT